MTTFQAGGNVPPFVELARELVGRGHSVHCVLQPSLQQEFEAAGAQWHPLRDGRPHEPFERVPLDQQTGDYWKVFFDLGYGSDLVREASALDSDAVVIDSYLFGATAVAAANGLPAIALVHTAFGFMYAIGSALVPRINAVRAGVGLDQVDATRLWTELDGVLIASSPLLETPLAVSPSNLHHCGPIFDERPDGSVAADNARGALPPHLLVALSTTYMGQERLLGNLLDAIGGLALRATVTVGPEVDTSGLTVPPNVTLGGRVRHASLMRTCQAVVTHGGHGTVSTALAMGLPILCLPLGRDQPFIADRVCAIGAGLRLAADSEPTAIAGALTRLLEEPVYRDAAREASRSIAAGGRGAANAADRLEEIHLRKI
jgi:UDP:flavonoid glycosyltransferase YjiC (YdhE family)